MNLEQTKDALEDFMYRPWELLNVANPDDPPPGPYYPIPGKEDNWFARRVKTTQDFEEVVTSALYYLLGAR